MKEFLRSILRKKGYDLVSYPYFRDKQRFQLFQKFGIQTILDIGANEGQFAQSIWNLGFEGNIISFEPVKSTFDKLAAAAGQNKNWIVRNEALGDKEGFAMMHVAENTLSSSLLAPNDVLLKTTPEARIVRVDQVAVNTLDSVCSEMLKDLKKNYFLKIDSQGYEEKILEGASLSLHQFTGIQIELSIEGLYEGERSFMNIFPLLLSKGFRLYEIQNGYCNPISGEVMQVELLLFRN